MDEIEDGGALLSSIGRTAKPHRARKGRKPRYMDFDCAECDSTPICAKGLCSRCYQRSRKQQLNATNAKKLTHAERALWSEHLTTNSSGTTTSTNTPAPPAPIHNTTLATQLANSMQNPSFNAGEALATLGNRRKCYPCPHCHKPFYKPSQTARHVRTHTGEKPFACPHMQCSRSFAEKGNLRRHLKMHTGEKPFTCNVCGRKFSRRSHLAEHLKAKNFDTHHGAPLPIQYAALMAPRAKVPGTPAMDNADEDDSIYSTEDEEDGTRKNGANGTPSLQERRATAELVKLATPVNPALNPTLVRPDLLPLPPPTHPRGDDAPTGAVKGKLEHELTQRRHRLQQALQLQLEQHPQLLQQCTAEQLQQFLLQQLSVPQNPGDLRQFNPQQGNGIGTK